MISSLKKISGRTAVGLLLLLLLLAAPAGPQATAPFQADVPVWTRLKVKEAFISRATSEKFRDAFSAPEFGWKILAPGSGRKVLARGSLYADLYFPFPPDFAAASADKSVRLSLIERDVFEDDRVASVVLSPGVQRYQLTEAGDFVQLERTRVEPDRASGGDSLPKGARLLRKSQLSGRVDFKAGDYTDYVRLPDDTGAVLILRDRFTLNWDLPGLISVADVMGGRFPRLRKAGEAPRKRRRPDSDGSSDKNGAAPSVFTAGGNASVVLDFASAKDSAESGRAADGQAKLLRLRGRIGGGSQQYRVFRTTRKAERGALIEQWLAFVRAQKPGLSQFSDDPAIAAIAGSNQRGNLAQALLAYDAAAALKVCRRKLNWTAGIASGSGRDMERVFCAHLLYERELPEDRRKLLQRFNSESKYYQDALKYENRRAESELKKEREKREAEAAK